MTKQEFRAAFSYVRARRRHRFEAGAVTPREVVACHIEPPHFLPALSCLPTYGDVLSVPVRLRRDWRKAGCGMPL